MSKRHGWGFTLIELLTVIAIIAILVGITAAVLPRVLEKGKLTRTESDFNQVRTALAQYQTEHGSLPPAYGYRLQQVPAGAVPLDQIFFLESWTVRAGIFQNYGLYDENWAENYDRNGNQQIDIMEFDPIGQENPATRRWAFDTTAIYNGANLPAEVQMQRNSIPPFAYYPVNLEQAQMYGEMCEAMGLPNGLTQAELDNWNSNQYLQQLLPQMPPPYYDDYVLISPGPGGPLSMGGIIPATANTLSDPYRPEGQVNGDDSYYINALNIFYLATRDADNNGKLDFDFRSRSREGERGVLPDGTNGYGPLIFPASPRANRLQ
jgi:prepilin-type N-terminal cleavage/methylation domain-containing protein